MSFTKSFLSLFFIITFVCLSFVADAQKNLLKGNAYFDRNMFREAIPYFQAEMEAGTNAKSKDEAEEKLADCYRLLGEFESAEKEYKKLVQRAKKNPNHILNYGLSLKASAKYQEAAEEFKKYIQVNPSDKMGSVYLESCSLAQKWLDESLGNEVKNLDFLNTVSSEFSPTFYKNGFVFCSSREGSKKKLISKDGANPIPALDFYFVNTQHPSDSFSVEVFEGGKLNTYMHEGPAVFSVTGDTIYFTKTVKGQRDDKKGIILKVLQIHTSHKTIDGNWSEPLSACSFNGTNYAVAHPSISPDGKTMCFMSDMPGGKGATDLYMSNRQQDGIWGTPVNMGDKINTFGNELFPFIYDDNTIYFSSDGYPGMGKLDIFFAKKINGVWGGVTNLKPPVNSIGDDFGYIMDRKYRQGLFSSDRFDSKGLEDIYAFSQFDPVKIIVDGDEFKIPNNTLFDGLKYKLIDIVTKQESILVSQSGYYKFTPEQGKQYTLSVRKEGFAYNKIDFDFKRNTDRSFFEMNITPKSKNVEVIGHLTQDVKDADNQVKKNPIANTNVELFENNSSVDISTTDKEGYFKFKNTVKDGVASRIIALKSSRTLTPQYTALGEVSSKEESVENAIVKLLKDGKVMEETTTNFLGMYTFGTKLDGKEGYVIEIQKEGYNNSSTSIISADYKNASNYKLNKAFELLPSPDKKSNEPVKKVDIFSVTKENTVQAKPISPPVIVTGLVKNKKNIPIAKAQVTLSMGNEVLSTVTTNALGTYFSTINMEGDYILTATVKGYFPNTVMLSTVDHKQLAMTITHIMDSIVLNKAVRIDNIYYDYNKTTIKYESIATLDNLVNFMEANPTVTIELSAHTDDRGSDDYNQKLSEGRALNAASYLYIEGISKNRVIYKGYGESKPVKKNAQTEEEHQLNRRTEFRVLKQ